METLKAGCFLINLERKSVALVYRKKQKDFSFPKGHLEKGESLEQCAVRETAEETKRVAKILKDFKPIVERYVTPSGEKCECHMFLALDAGPSDNDSQDTHQVVWTSIDKVENKLSYLSLKQTWNKVKYEVYKIAKY